MSKRIIFIGLITLSILCISPMIHAEQYYDQYPGTGFVPDDETAKYEKEGMYGSLYHNDASDMTYYCPVTFNVPDGSVYFIKSLGIRYKDNLNDGEIWIMLMRHNLYTGAFHEVADWISGTLDASPSAQTASKGTNTGVKLIDTKKFAYWLKVRLYASGSNPSTDLKLHQVRIHYGT